jgi:hypothetical protein
MWHSTWCRYLPVIFKVEDAQLNLASQQALSQMTILARVDCFLSFVTVHQIQILFPHATQTMIPLIFGANNGIFIIL